MFEARWRRWYGVTRHDRWAILGGQLVAPVRQRKPPFWVWNAGLNQLYMSAYHISPEFVRYYLDALIKYRVKYILGYSSTIYYLAETAVKANYQNLKLDVAITNAEPLYDYQRSVIESAFNCPVRETYGMAEMAAAAGECDHGKLHIWKDAGIIEIDSISKDESESGDLICTGLVNEDMPFIRYRVGDYGSLSKDKCSCGKTLSLLEGIDGRSDDVLYTKDGKRIGRLDPVFKNDLLIIEAQIIQNSLSHLIVKIIPAENFNQKSANQLINQIKERMGNIEISLEKVSQIPRTSRGKFRAVICKLSREERDKVSAAEEAC